jgi:ClpP class serine protease
MNVYYALNGEYLEQYYVFREIESKVRTEISVEMIKEIQQRTLAFASDAPILSVEGSIAKIKIDGMLEQYETVSSFLSGPMTTYENIEKATLEAVSDHRVKEIEYHISSPGGTWEGIDYCAEVIAKAGKPTKAIVYSQAQSGGYFLASQADKIYAQTKGSMVGSIGVAVELFDRTQEDGKKGIRRLVFTNTQSTDKRYDPATEAGSDILVEHLDMLYTIFENRVITGRRKQRVDFSEQSIRQLRGRTVTAEKALEIGLIDNIISEQKESERTISSGISLENKGAKEMKLSEFIAQGVEAEQELNEYTDKAVAASEERILEIIKISGINLSDRAQVAIKTGLNAGDFAKQEVSELRASLTQPNVQQLGSATPDTSLDDMQTQLNKKTSKALVLF